MATLTLTGQTTAKTQFDTRWTAVKTELLKRKPIWDTLTVEQKKAWLASGNDPLFTLLWQVFLWLGDNFFFPEEVLRG